MSDDIGTGTVKFYLKDKGYGFILSDGKEYFVHHSNINTPDKQLYQNQQVRFNIISTERGIAAVDVVSA